MILFTQNQYNQEISKYKLLSSTAGVGAIVTTKLGYYVLISDIEKWKFIQSANRKIREIRDTSKESEWYNQTKILLPRIGLRLVDDLRFVKFLIKERNYNNLLCLVAIPQLALNDTFNTVDVKNNPNIVKIRNDGDLYFGADDLSVPGTHFPKWFINSKGVLKTYDSWRTLWTGRGKLLKYFVPPRDVNSPYKDANGNIKTLKIRNPENEDATIEIELYKELIQLNQILICPNGHLSDIPWAKYLKWKTNFILKHDSDQAENLFDEFDCCTNPNLKWSENRNKSEGYGSIYIECLNCGLGSGSENIKPKVNLEGITNILPKCKGHRPWESADKGNVSKSECKNQNGIDQSMQVALVTANNIYFATVFSSLYIPYDLASGINEECLAALNILEARFSSFRSKRSDISRETWFNKNINDDFIVENDFNVPQMEMDLFLTVLKTHFLKREIEEDVQDTYEDYRWQEYKTFCGNKDINRKNFSFHEIVLPQVLTNYFLSIKQVKELQLSSVQLEFTRVKPIELVLNKEGNLYRPHGMNIFSFGESELYALPANENYGEGIFIQFNQEQIDQWINQNTKIWEIRLLKMLSDNLIFGPGNTNRLKIKNYGVKYLLIHTFSHLMMRELEFTCGYPTASLKERLYISQRMAGLLIYTAEGSEGSMGGLISQALPSNFLLLMKNAFRRAMDCSSDPLCWESDGQGISDLNLAACFSCALVSETACEEMNLGLDRRVLIDSEWGFFKDFVI